MLLLNDKLLDILGLTSTNWDDIWALLVIAGLVIGGILWGGNNNNMRPTT